jgi:uncharacterized protein (TIGR00375 family)
MTFLADLHVHSQFSRATAKNLDLEHLYMAAQRKGITVVGTGDATHPEWFEAIRTKLVPAEPGLFRLRDDLAAACDREVPRACRAPVRFILVSEISNIYKKDGRTRKNHNLVYLPSTETAARFNRELDKIGNIQSDGRPILGLDARDLLEIVLEADDNAFLVPAHIWTPWFSLLGSKSGFDSLEACFDDLAGHVFAVETGLSSDPPMNRRISSLDRLTLISNSDAHSPVKLGREANIFHTALDYTAMRRALKSNDPAQFGGTLEFYPEEGKYHLDGHRKCGLRFTPSETRNLDGICPGCRKPLTKGVLYRVESLADRRIENIPEGFPPYENLIPLHDILSEVLQVGPNTKTVARAYAQLLAVHGSELEILRNLAPDELEATGPPLIGEAVARMRSGRVRLAAGYDGEYGRIEIFSASERRDLMGQQHLFAMAPQNKKVRRSEPAGDSPPSRRSSPVENASGAVQASAAPRPNTGQRQAINHGPGPLMIVAGPGTGKTTTLTRRIAHLLTEGRCPADRILAITFTDKAAREMRERLRHLLPGRPLPLAATFHAFCRQLMHEDASRNPPTVLDEPARLFILEGILRRMGGEGLPIKLKPRELLARIETAKQNLQPPDQFFESVALETAASQFARGYREYQALLAQQGGCDFDDLIMAVVLRLETEAGFRETMQKRFRQVFIDEYQDLNHAQYRLVKVLVPPDGNICVIGDPDQAIYGFRGSDTAYFNRFVEDFPDAAVIHLERNYRSTETILEASWQIIRHRGRDAGPAMPWARLVSGKQGAATVAVLEQRSEKAEAVAVGRIIESQVGGTGFLAIDAGKVDSSSVAAERSFGDFAVLFRTLRQAEVFAEVFTRAGIPFQTASRRNQLERPGVAPLLALYRLVNDRGSPRDLAVGAGLWAPVLDKPLLNRFLDWQARQGNPFSRALEATAELPADVISAAQRARLQGWVRALAQLKTKLGGRTPADQLTMLVKQLTVEEESDRPAPGPEETIAALADLAADCGDDHDRFMARLALLEDADTLREGVEKVALLSMHAAKGLEFPVVFIAGCEDGLVPFDGIGGKAADPAEERRLFYVAMTRARDQLYFTWSRRRTIYGRKCDQRLSPFVSEIEARLLAHQSLEAADSRRSRQVQLKLF